MQALQHHGAARRHLLTEAARLHGPYGLDAGRQRAVFFELQTADFALLAIDTGILRMVDERQWAWLERALDQPGQVHYGDRRPSEDCRRP